MLTNKVRNVFLIAVIVAAVCAGGRLEAVDQAQALGSASAETVESWNAWRRDNPGSVASAFPWADIPACFVEDGSVSVDGGSAYQHVCKWDASTAGNGDGTSYVLVDGVSVVQWLFVISSNSMNSSTDMVTLMLVQSSVMITCLSGVEISS